MQAFVTVTVTVTCATCTALVHTGYPGWGDCTPPKVEMENIAMDPAGHWQAGSLPVPLATLIRGSDRM